MGAKSFKVKINPVVLRWARTNLGFELAQLAHTAKLSESHLESVEAGLSEPTFTELKKIAKVLKRPTAFFFLPEAPKEQSLPADYRTHRTVNPDDSLDVTLELRKIQQARLNALDLARSIQAEVPVFSIKLNLSDDTEQAGKQLREYLRVTYNAQRALKSESEALRFWRDRSEDAGVLVFQASVDPEREFRGASIFAELYPAVLLSTKDSYHGRIFTICHELTHLALRGQGLCSIDPGSKGTVLDPVEIFCNAVSGACLVPAEYLLAEKEVKEIEGPDWPEAIIKRLANRYRVSMEVLLRRLLTTGKTDENFYRKFRNELAKRPIKQRKGGAVEWYKKAISKNGYHYTRLVLGNLDAGNITISDVSDTLGIKTEHLPKTRRAAFGKVSGE